MAKQSKFQSFETDTISRTQICGAEYNPRVISEDARKRLRKMIAKHGLVQPLVWNRRTGNLVAGHQRLAALDSLERSQDYDLLVAVVDVDEREERVLNVQLNNPSMQGEWDMDKLTELAEEAAISPDEFGFSDGDIAVMFGDDGRLDELLGDVPEVTEAKNTLKEIKEHRAESMAKMQEAQAADFYFTVVCESEAQKKAILKLLAVPDWEAFVNGRILAGKLGL
ncbi:ParB N-terminal domain-containing protein [uncultured Desulfovibrio sp.]|uniref:ParB N-terminal domain-containing protein n=1 Tax=uncultured Desulfovibrio sp. TaxID=167968 RepID=UPI00272B5C8D|nr:ParB N-terminal domain-containing protein [uncultured Desulfovibrio sp.]